MLNVSACELKKKDQELHTLQETMSRNYQICEINSDSSSSIFHFNFLAIIPIHMEIPLFFNKIKVDNFKMMAKVIGKSVSPTFFL